MKKLDSGRTLYYGKGDVMTYRTYAAPLSVGAIEESPFAGNENVIFAHNIKFSVSGETLLASFTEGDNGQVVATDSMKNFILRQSASYEGSTTEGLLAYIGEKFFEKYEHISAIDIEAFRIPFGQVLVRGEHGYENSKLVYRPSHNERAHAKLELIREANGASATSLHSGVSDLQLIKVSGSSFYGFIRDEYTTLPESYDRPLFIFLNINWTYIDHSDALSGESYVAAEQIRDIAHHVFHEYETPSIQYLIYRIGLRILTRFPRLSEVFFESNNRTWETVVEPAGIAQAGVYTEPRPPYGFQGFTVTREDLEEAGIG
ncbi:factor-independent urate hydroxylase [Cohnella lupini]|uniref:Uricase n=1 Tax=Cohnella lupini TaxID=1294267 RepID=A0A3D9IWL0_9BACL|nr:urate oxidase [Cohnella lupini]RED65987.1 urate oxidase [Cohnella lupini]